MRGGRIRRAVACQRGFALLIVLWTLVLIAFIIAHVTATGRTEVRIAGNLAANAAAQMAADGGIYQAIFQLSDPRPDHRWALDGDAHELVIGKSSVAIRIEDESGRINPNLASAALLEGLLRACGSNPREAPAIAAAIMEWAGSVTPARSPAELAAEYRAAGLDYAPPGAPMESIDELGRVRGMTPELLAALRPHLTLFGTPEPNITAADPIVVAAIAFADEDSSIAAAPTAAPDIVTVRISATAQGPGAGQSVRAAVVRIEPAAEHGYTLLAWGDTVE